MSDEEKIKNLPTYHGGRNRTLARRMIDAVGGQDGIRKRVITSGDGKTTTRLTTRAGMPEIITTTTEDKGKDEVLILSAIIITERYPRGLEVKKNGDGYQFVNARYGTPSYLFTYGKLRIGSTKKPKPPEWRNLKPDKTWPGLGGMTWYDVRKKYRLDNQKTAAWSLMSSLPAGRNQCAMHELLRSMYLEEAVLPLSNDEKKFGEGGGLPGQRLVPGGYIRQETRLYHIQRQTGKTGIILAAAPGDHPTEGRVLNVVYAIPDPIAFDALTTPYMLTYKGDSVISSWTLPNLEKTPAWMKPPGPDVAPSFSPKGDKFLMSMAGHNAEFDVFEKSFQYLPFLGASKGSNVVEVMGYMEPLDFKPADGEPEAKVGFVRLERVSKNEVTNTGWVKTVYDNPGPALHQNTDVNGHIYQQSYDGYVDPNGYKKEEQIEKNWWTMGQKLVFEPSGLTLFNFPTKKIYEYTNTRYVDINYGETPETISLEWFSPCGGFYRGPVEIVGPPPSPPPTTVFTVEIPGGGYFGQGYVHFCGKKTWVFRAPPPQIVTDLYRDEVKYSAFTRIAGVCADIRCGLAIVTLENWSSAEVIFEVKEASTNRVVGTPITVPPDYPSLDNHCQPGVVGKYVYVESVVTKTVERKELPKPLPRRTVKYEHILCDLFSGAKYKIETGANGWGAPCDDVHNQALRLMAVGDSSISKYAAPTQGKGNWHNVSMAVSRDRRTVVVSIMEPNGCDVKTDMRYVPTDPRVIRLAPTSPSQIKTTNVVLRRSTGYRDEPASWDWTKSDLKIPGFGSDQKLLFLAEPQIYEEERER